MRQKVSPWGDLVSDADLAYALLGLGLLDSSLYRDPVAALEALAATLQRGKDQAYRWRFDMMPSSPQAWGQLPDAASLAALVRIVTGARPLRFALLPGSVLSTVEFRSFVATALMAHEVATYVTGHSSRRKLQLRWPLRLGFPPGPDAEQHVADMRVRDSWGGNVYEAFVLSRRRPECDFLVCVEHQSDATEMLRQASREVGTVRADLVVVFTSAQAAPSHLLARLDETRALADAGGSVHLGEAQDYAMDRLRSVCMEVSHNLPLDAAIAFATQGRGLLLASPALIEKTRLEFKVRELVASLQGPAEANVAMSRSKGIPWLDVVGASTSAGQPPSSPEPTRDAIATYLRYKSGSFRWEHESGEASDLGHVMRSLAEDDVSEPRARFLQAGFAARDSPHRPLSGALESASIYVVNVIIGVPQSGYVLGNASFPDLPPIEDGRSHELDVVFWEPALCPRPQVKKMQLPPRGTTSPVAFELATGDATTAVHARISVLHRNRVLQTGMLTAPVGREGLVSLKLDSIPRRVLNGLDERTNFSLAMVLNDVEGEGAIHVMADAKAQTFSANDPAVTNLVTTIGAAISAIANNPNHYKGLGSRGSQDLLLRLAARGAHMRQYLERHVVDGGKLITPDFVQVVATRPGKFFPLEFVYDWTAPDMDARLCPNAAEALDKGDCLQTCQRYSNPAAMDQVVCPFGFWGVRCVIERRLHDNTRATPAEPVTRERAVLKPLSSILIGASPKADAVVPKSVSGMLDRIRKLDANCQQVTQWSQWPEGVVASKPTTLALVVHQEMDVDGTPLLEIGPPPLLPSIFLGEKHVAAPGSGVPPIVLLIGCETALAQVSYESFAVQFQWSGAAHVVSTIAGVAGRQAAPMTADILEALSKVSEPTSFAHVMRDVRRQLLASGTPMVLALTSEGDADWEVVGSPE